MVKAHNIDRFLDVILRKEINCDRLKFRVGVESALQQDRTVATCDLDILTVA
jgi:hypothetical protein